MNVHLNHPISYDSHNHSSPGPSHSLVSDGELIEEELNLGVSFNLSIYLFSLF